MRLHYFQVETLFALSGQSQSTSDIVKSGACYDALPIGRGSGAVGKFCSSGTHYLGLAAHPSIESFAEVQAACPLPSGKTRGLPKIAVNELPVISTHDNTIPSAS